MHRISFLILIVLIGLGQSAVAAEKEPLPPLALDIRVIGNDWEAVPADVDKVLHSTADPLVVHFPGRKVKPILVSRGQGVPVTLDLKGPAGEFQVHLATGNMFWAQYTYQFAHELCHILCNCDQHHRGRHQWFEEALCETSSLYVLSTRRQAWETNPPYPNWKSWGIHFEQYLDHILADRARHLPPDVTMRLWLKSNLPQLETERGLTDRSKLVAVYLFAIFQDEPDGWESLNWYHPDDKDSALDFEAFLHAWKARVPARHKAFVGKIQMLFGYR